MLVVNNLRIRISLCCTVAWVALACQGKDPTAPLCLAPLPLRGADQPHDPSRYIVTFRANVDAIHESARLSAKYGFTPIHVWSNGPDGFDAELAPAVVLALRCEPTVSAVSCDQIGYLTFSAR